MDNRRGKTKRGVLKIRGKEGASNVLPYYHHILDTKTTSCGNDASNSILPNHHHTFNKKLFPWKDSTMEDPREVKAEVRLNHVLLNGCIVNGAGLAMATMATMDVIKFRRCTRG